jgi:flagellar motor switch protein FliM
MEPADAAPETDDQPATRAGAHASGEHGQDEEADGPDNPTAPGSTDGPASTDGPGTREPSTAGERSGPFDRPATPAVRSFDFRRPSKLTRDHIRSLEMVHETFAGQFATVLSSSLRVVATTAVTGIDELTYDEYVHELPSQTHLVFLSLEPLPGLTTLQLPLDSALVLVDLLLGGQGRRVPDRPLTDIESSLVRKLLERGLDELAFAYESVLQISPEITGHESNPQFAQTVAPSDLVVVVRFTLDVATATPSDPAPITLCYPLSSLQPVLDAVAGTTQDGDGLRGAVEARQVMAARLHEVPVEVCVRFRPRPLSAEEILNLSPGDILVLPHAADAPLTASVGEVPMFEVQPARRGRKVAVHVTERLDVGRLDLLGARGASNLRPPSGTESDR